MVCARRDSKCQGDVKGETRVRLAYCKIALFEKLILNVIADTPISQTNTSKVLALSNILLDYAQATSQITQYSKPNPQASPSPLSIRIIGHELKFSLILLPMYVTPLMLHLVCFFYFDKKIHIISTYINFFLWIIELNYPNVIYSIS